MWTRTSIFQRTCVDQEFPEHPHQARFLCALKEQATPFPSTEERLMRVGDVLCVSFVEPRVYMYV